MSQLIQDVAAEAQAQNAGTPDDFCSLNYLSTEGSSNFLPSLLSPSPRGKRGEDSDSTGSKPGKVFFSDDGGTVFIKVGSKAESRNSSKETTDSGTDNGTTRSQKTGEESVVTDSDLSSEDGIKAVPSSREPQIDLEAGSMPIAKAESAGGYSQIFLFTVNIVVGIIGSQLAYGLMPHNVYHLWYEVVTMVSLLCLSFIMINVGYEFVLDKSKLRSYGTDTLVAMTAAGFPWLFVAGWFIWALPNPLSWKEALVMGRFAAPTSAGVLFCMLEAAGLKETWLFKKARILAIFDDLDTILFMVPLKAILIGLKWELFVILAIVFLLLGLGYTRLHAYRLPKGWRWTAMYALVITAMTETVYYVTKKHIMMEAIHIEVLLPAFILGVIIDTEDNDDDQQPDDDNSMPSSPKWSDEQVQTCVSALFMVFVGLSMPPLFGDQGVTMSAGAFFGHVVAVSTLMVLGKMFPLACYQTEANLRTRFALAMGMCPRGEVGAGVILISLDLGIKGEAVAVAIVCLALNMVMTGGFILTVKRLVSDCLPDKQRVVLRLTRKFTHIYGGSSAKCRRRSHEPKPVEPTHAEPLKCKVKCVGVVFALVAGSTNAIAFYALNAFVSHVTGSITKTGMHAEDGSTAAYACAGLVISYILGGVFCGCIIMKGMVGFEAIRYGIASQTSAILLLCVVVAANAGSSTSPYIAAAACGLQNAICTSFSGGAIRISHVTGIATDIGILCGRLIMRGIQQRSTWIAEKCGMRAAVATQDVAGDIKKLTLLSMLISSFFIGIVLGSFLHENFGVNAFLVPAMITSTCSAAYTSYHCLRYSKKAAKEFEDVLPFANVSPAVLEPCPEESPGRLDGDQKLSSNVRHSPILEKTTESPIAEAEVKEAQDAWASAIVGISKTYLDKGDYVSTAADAAGKLYGYGDSKVLFKPTKAAQFPFRPTASEAMSYFVGAKAVKDGYAEDGGFAINSGKGWSKVVFDNHEIELLGNTAIAMGTYYFTCATTGDKTKVEYTFGYKRSKSDGKLRIFLHHSSVPYTSGPPTDQDKITKAEVEEAQKAWASAIADISKTYLDKGDYVATAADAAGKLYGYGDSNVLFKPTKAAQFPFRPTASEAMSYFVGAKAVKDGYAEDGGFAINGGKGWSKVVFDNHQIELLGNTAIAMGTYYFTCATTGDKTKVEYTFGYKRSKTDGKLRIFLHHSSVPYTKAKELSAPRSSTEILI